jgi:hypothetical protein
MNLKACRSAVHPTGKGVVRQRGSHQCSSSQNDVLVSHSGIPFICSNLSSSCYDFELIEGIVTGPMKFPVGVKEGPEIPPGRSAKDRRMSLCLRRMNAPPSRLIPSPRRDEEVEPVATRISLRRCRLESGLPEAALAKSALEHPARTEEKVWYRPACWYGTVQVVSEPTREDDIGPRGTWVRGASGTGRMCEGSLGIDATCPWAVVSCLGRPPPCGTRPYRSHPAHAWPDLVNPRWRVVSIMGSLPRNNRLHRLDRYAGVSARAIHRTPKATGNVGPQRLAAYPRSEPPPRCGTRPPSSAGPFDNVLVGGVRLVTKPADQTRHAERKSRRQAAPVPRCAFKMCWS